MSLIALLALALQVTLAPTVAGASAAPPKTYYLALGDSLAYGYQPDLDLFHGYTNDFFASLQSHVAKAMVNYGCPAESTSTFIHGGCPYQLFVHNFYLGPQLAAAVSFIKSHPGQVSPVSLDIGANDLEPLINKSTCAISPSYPTALSAFDTNFQAILWQLVSALNGGGTLVVMNYYDPYQNTCPNTVPLVQLFNWHIAYDAAVVAYALHTVIPVADVFSAFGGATTPNPNICTLTWMCSSARDVHPTTAGYAVIARAFESAYYGALTAISASQ